VIHKALVGGYACKIGSIGGNKYRTNASENPRDSREIDYGLLECAILAKGYEKDREDQQTAEMKGKSAGVKKASALGAFYHVAHNLACLADGADSAHNTSGDLEREIFLFADIGQQADESGAKSDPNEMLGGKHYVHPPVGNFT
jgi:hypothetical protein